MRTSEEDSALISSKNRESVTQQFRRVLLDKINSGALPRGLLIPSERELSEQYKISRTSVREGLAQLLAEGVLIRGGLRGTYVAETPPRKESATKSTAQLGFWIAENLFHFVQPGYNRILTGSSDACQQLGYTLRFYAVGERNLRTLLESPLDASLQGSIIVGGASPGLTDKLRNSGQPLVLVDLLTQFDTAGDSIRIDYEGGIALALTHLTELGHSDIGFIGFPNSQKYEAFWSGLDKRGFRYQPRFVEFLDQSGLDAGTVAGFRAMQKILARKPCPTAIVATNDLVALGAAEALAVAGVSVPDQISIVGFDDLAGSAASLSTVSADLMAVGRLAAETLMTWIETGDKPVFPIVVPVEMVVRGSTAAVAKLRS